MVQAIQLDGLSVVDTISDGNSIGKVLFYIKPIRH
jgi:hypothetical protein